MNIYLKSFSEGVNINKTSRQWLNVSNIFNWMKSWALLTRFYSGGHIIGVLVQWVNIIFTQWGDDSNPVIWGQQWEAPPQHRPTHALKSTTTSERVQHATEVSTSRPNPRAAYKPRVNTLTLLLSFKLFHYRPLKCDNTGSVQWHIWKHTHTHIPAPERQNGSSTTTTNKTAFIDLHEET